MEDIKNGLSERQPIKNGGMGDRRDDTGIPKAVPAEKTSKGGKSFTIK